jgi:hypothetical protein
MPEEQVVFQNKSWVKGISQSEALAGKNKDIIFSMML